MKSHDTKKIINYGIFIAIVTVCCYINIHIPIGKGGLIHLGTLSTFVIAIKYGKNYGAIAGGFGAFLFDVLTNWVLWAPGSLVIRLIMGYVVGLISEKKNGESILLNIVSILVGGIIIVLGYLIYESLFLLPLENAVLNMIGNSLQVVIGMFAVFVVPKIKDPIEQ